MTRWPSIRGWWAARRRAALSAGEEILVCGRCGSDVMHVIIRRHDSEALRCARCGDLVAYTSQLVRVKMQA